MTDQELLELAAKAAGWADQLDFSGDCPKWRIQNRGGIYWNPLAEDGDAFRLMVRLSLSVTPPDDRFKMAFVEWRKRDASDDAYVDEPAGGDWDHDTRRAVVRAAAEIGRRMES